MRVGVAPFPLHSPVGPDRDYDSRLPSLPWKKEVSTHNQIVKEERIAVIEDKERDTLISSELLARQKVHYRV